MNLRIITASAGSGKTWRLTKELDDAIAAGRARPEHIVATTFTTQAAAELIERARARMLQHGRGRAAHQLLAARIGTVNSVCGALVSEHAFDLGMSPAMRVLDDAGAEVELRRALSQVVSDDTAAELDAFKGKFDMDHDWRDEVSRIVEAARANDLGATELVACATRSMADLDACLGSTTNDDLDDLLAVALVTAIAAIEAGDDPTKGTALYLETLRTSAHGGLSWGMWAKLAKEAPTKRSLVHSAPVREVAKRHVEHRRLRTEMRRWISLHFELAAAVLDAYQHHKRMRGLIDLTDQESLALQLLRRPEIRAGLEGQIDLFLVDEFQDTSPIQLAVFLELAHLATESIWVGDPKQAIYGFRGTDPALMDAAIESLTSTTADSELVASALRTLEGRTEGEHRTVESLGTSYRSRPALVDTTSAIFARAFAPQGIPEERTRLVPHLRHEPAGLGEVVEYWPLDLDRGEGHDNETGRAAAAAAGVRELLRRGAPVRDLAHRGGIRPATPRDIAILCRTNKQCQAVADELGALGVAVIVPRMRLFATAEAQVIRAGLALWLDPHDTLAAAELARIITHPTDLDGFVENLLSAPPREAFRDDPTVARIIAARAADRDLGPLAALDAVIAATELRVLCAGWGQSVQRLANLDAMRAHATTYVRSAASRSDAATLAGLLRYLDALLPTFAGWSQTRSDRQAVLSGEEAVTVSTWHRAKGLEWPITVLFGLESLREPTPYGVHVMTDRTTFNVADPLGGRWIRCWPNPYAMSNQLGAVRDALEKTSAHATLVASADREALRVLYVGWTRARDRLVLAARRGRLLRGIVGKLAVIDPSLFHEPAAIEPGVENLRWAGTDVAVRIAPSSPAPPVVAPREPGTITVGRPVTTHLPARQTPSSAAPVPSSLGEIVVLGPRIPIAGEPDMEIIGDAIHAFLAADRGGLEDTTREAIANEVIANHGCTTHLAAVDVVAAATRLWNWICGRFPDARIHREWPLAHRTESGAVVAGTADLVLVSPTAIVVIDHKSFPGATEAAAMRALSYSGQLAAYAAALHAASGLPVRSTFIHFPIGGRMVEVRLNEEAGR